jgi:hypothetical protein
MRRLPLKRVAAALLLLLMGGLFSSLECRTLSTSLGDVLASAGVPKLAGSLIDRSQRIIDFVKFSDNRYVLVAYFEALSPTHLVGPLRLLLFDRRTSRFKQCALAGQEYIGSVLEIRRVGRFFYVELHFSPSAANNVVLTTDLRLRDYLVGWIVAVLPDGRVVYESSMTHFAPTHSPRLFVYEPTSKETRQIYPLKPYQALRLAHIEKARIAWSDDAWCNAHNHHCDPEQFENDIGKVSVSPDSDALAFGVTFDNDLRRERQVKPTEVIYVYRGLTPGHRLRYRELLAADVERRFGKVATGALLELARLRRIF